MRRELTKREIEVLRLICYPNKDICNKLCLSISTVKTHIRNIMCKFNVKSREQSLMLALRYHILGIKDVDIGFWDNNGVYIEDIQPVNLRKE